MLGSSAERQKGKCCALLSFVAPFPLMQGWSRRVWALGEEIINEFKMNVLQAEER